jgi:chromosome segregation ATPase
MSKIDQIMEQAQVFASAWSLVGGMLDSGNALEDAETEKRDLRQTVTDALESLQSENAELRQLAERVKLEAQMHAQEARTANATIAEIYQVISGATGEPGNWHGAEPVREYVAGLRRDRDEWKDATVSANQRFKQAESKVDELRRQLEEARKDRREVLLDAASVFPVVLRKMWSGGDVVEWLCQEADRAAIKGEKE